MKIKISEITKKSITVSWEAVDDADSYALFWGDKDSPTFVYEKIYEGKECSYTENISTHIPYYFYAEAYKDGEVLERSEKIRSEAAYRLDPQLEKLNRGIVAINTGDGIFVAWRMFKDEAKGAVKERLTGTDYILYRKRPGEEEMEIALVTDSTNYLDKDGREGDSYCVAPVRAAAVPDETDMGCKVETDTVSKTETEAVRNTEIGEKSEYAEVIKGGKNYLEIPLKKPADGVTPRGDAYTYSANDMSIGDVDGDGELEYFVKWDPSNSHDVSHRGYTGNCYIDCYKLDGRLLWRLDMGVNIRSGAHYTQFMVYDFDGDGKAEMSVKTAPGTKMTIFDEDGNIISERYITLPKRDIEAGVTNEDDYVCSAADFYEYTVKRFMNWQEHEEVRNGHWPATLEECFGIPVKYEYPLSREDACALADYFMDEFAPAKDERNKLREFEGFIYEGPEYLTMFSGAGEELETIDFPVPRGDDGLMWGDYVWKRIEPCNRVDRFQSAVGYLDGEHPFLLICRGYYTRSTITAYRFENRHHELYFKVDSGHVPIDNPFRSHSGADGTDPVYGCITGQGDHSLSVADVDFDGCDEIIYGACTIDNDGSVLYSSKDAMPDGRLVKLGHGDSMHVARIDPDRPGFEIFNVFEGASSVPYGYALRDARTGKVFFGEPANRDLGRCMIGDIDPNVRGLQVWVGKVQDCHGNVLDDKLPGTNANIKWAADLSTQVVDGVDYVGGKHIGLIGDNTHGIMLEPEGCATNNGTKGNPCLIADIFGDFREEIVLRTEDSSAVRIYVNTEITDHKLFTLLHDPMYRCGVAWQNNVYNQPCYTSFYYASDMDFREVL
ncbi:MAG: rhamnogalacturonan lyase [Lachnospiraceae bacterium]|nr:rhamnogalacturonan lyase [Lachnospiraceae bacterium]